MQTNSYLSKLARKKKYLFAWPENFQKQNELFYKNFTVTNFIFYLLTTIKGQIISKCLFGVFNFFQKTNESTSHSSKNEFEINWPLVLASPYLQFWFAELICLLLIVSSETSQFRKKNIPLNIFPGTLDKLILC